MISEEEVRKIKSALKKNKQTSVTLIIVMLCFGVLFTFSLFQFFPQLFPTISLLTILSLIFIAMFRFFYEICPSTKIQIKDEGIEIPKVRKTPFKIIRYDWIEIVILNEMRGGSLYVDVFFTKDGKKYIYSDFQTRIGDYRKFVKTLREKGIKVEILEPSLKYQKKHDFGWIGDMMRGREWVK